MSNNRYEFVLTMKRGESSEPIAMGNTLEEVEEQLQQKTGRDDVDLEADMDALLQEVDDALRW